MSMIYYFGIFNNFFQTSINNIEHYDLLLKVKKIDNKSLEVIDVLHYSNTFYQLNVDTFYLHFKDAVLLPNTIIEFEDDNFNNIIKISHPESLYPIYINSTPIYFSYINKKLIMLENLDKIKDMIIKNNKILSE